MRVETEMKKGQIWAVIVLGAIMLLGFLFRLDNLAARTMGHIEVYVPGIELPEELSWPKPRLSLETTIKDSLHEPHPPGWYIIMWPWTKIFGTDLFVIRLPSVLFGVGSIFLVYWLGTLHGDRLTALLAAGLLAFNGHHVFWSQIARPATMTCFVGLLSTLLLHLILRGHRKRMFTWLYIVITLGGMGMLYYFWFLFAAHILYVLLLGWKQRTPLSDLLRLQLLILILATPLITLAIYQSRQSYLEHTSGAFISQFISFGFLFEPDRDVTRLLPAYIKWFLLFLSLFLLVIGLVRRREGFNKNFQPDVSGPSILQLALASGFAFLSMLCIIYYFYNQEFYYRANKMAVISTVIPFLLFLLAFLLQRYSISHERIGAFLSDRYIGALEPLSLISLLFIIPVLMVGVINIFIPFYASRHMLLFTPYLLLILAGGIVFIFRNNNVWRFSPILSVVLILFLGTIHYGSIIYNKQRPQSPTDYKGLAAQWIPHIKDSDIIFVQRHWVLTPIFYYLKGDQYHFIAKNYSQEIYKKNYPRVWLLSFNDLPPKEEMNEALLGYKRSMTIEALRTKTELYVKQP